ncbi:hypothetical protein BC834DRAFT_970475 [Gloeopeniophorella convolvens]|nr:hypothetical protein BC834DRAFT_970475 [Gloeopeniophorella convolvens]
MSFQTFGKGALRVAKNYTKGYSDVQAKVREATSNDPWGPSGTQMNEIAQMTYNQNDFVEIMEMLDKRLNDKGKNWRHVFKCLTVLDYLLHAGSENVVIYFRDNIYIIKTLKEFQFVDEYGKDQGANVRQKAKDITNLLTDPARLREERRSRASMRDRMLGAPGEEGDDDASPPQREDENSARRARGAGVGDDELRRAIEESKRSLAAEQARGAEDADLARALRLSEEEEAKRKAGLTDSGSLFDEQNNNLIDLQGQNNNALQPQYTMQPQFTSFNPYQQQAQQEAMQAEWQRQQQEWLQQQQLQQQQQQQDLQQQQLLQAQQEEWMRQQLAQQQQQQQQALLAQQQQSYLASQAQLVPQQTSFNSNNPFAASSPAPPVPSPQPPVRSPISDFSLPSTYESYAPPPRQEYASSPQPAPAASPQPAPNRGPTRADQEHAHLANLFAAPRDDGMDTFGNVGALRYGNTEAGRLVAQKTGAAPQSNFNPFAQQQQQQQQQQQAQSSEQAPFFTI